MIYFKNCSCCLVLLAVYLINAQNIDLKTAMGTTKNTGHKIAEDSEGHLHRKGRDNVQDSQLGTDQKPININLLPNPELMPAVSMTAKAKSTQMPIHFVIDTKPRTIPTKIPVVIKAAGKIVPGPAHYVRLKANPNRKRISDPNVNLGFKKEAPLVTAIDKVTPKSSHVHNTKSKNQASRIHKSKSVHFFEDDDTNTESLPPAKQTVTRKSKKTEHKHHSSTITEHIHDKDKNDEDKNDVHIKNATHVIHISKIPQRSDNTEIGFGNERRHHNKLIEDRLHDVSLADTLDYESFEVPKKDEVHIKFLNNDDTSSLNTQSDTEIEDLTSSEPPFIAQTTDATVTEATVIPDDSSDIITVIDHKYEEVEDISAPVSNIDIDDTNGYMNIDNRDGNSQSSPIEDAIPTQTYNNYAQNMLTAYDQYLKYWSENNINKINNCYPQTMTGDTSDYQLPYPLASGTQIAQSVLRPASMINFRPDINPGRIWRTWKDTEIKIRKPNKDGGRNYYDYGEIFSKPNQMFGSQVTSCYNGCYDNLNNPVPYAYTFQPYRYVM